MMDKTWIEAFLTTSLAKVRDDRGWAISTEQLLWIIGIIAVVGVIVLALNAYISGKLALIR